MLTLKLLSIAALFGSVAWLVHSPDYEPAIASITALSACITAFFADWKNREGAAMNQSVEKGAIGIQAGGNVSTGNISSDTIKNSHVE